MPPVDHLIEVLNQRPEIQLAVLFGSHTRGGARRGSDLDVGLSVTRGASFPSELAIELERATGQSIDLISLDEAPPLLRFEVARSGIVLVARDPHAWADFRARAMIDWWDWAPTARMMHRVMAERLREEAEEAQRSSEAVAAKAAPARGWINDAAALLLVPLDEFQADAKGRDLALFYLFLDLG